MAALVERVEKLGTVPPEEDNMLKISSDARKASLDVRMVDPSAPHNPDGKVSMAARTIAKIHKEEEENKGTQLVFLDMGTPKAREAKDSDNGGRRRRIPYAGRVRRTERRLQRFAERSWSPTK